MKDLRKGTGKKVSFILEGIHYESGNPVRIEVIDGLIERITETEDIKNENYGVFIAPGLIDNQVNGYEGVDFSGNNLTAEDFIAASRAILKDGVTSFLPTLITNSHENLVRNFRILAQAVEKDEMLAESIPGFHLEGPYISPEEGYRGCHPVQHIRKPSWEEFHYYQQAAGGRIIQVTLAPEIEGGMEFIGLCNKNKLIVAIGHTNACAKQIMNAVENGARLSTHLGNGCANYIHRHLNPIWPQLANNQLVSSIIADGQHLTPEEIQVFFKVKGPENIILTSDIIYLAGMNPGKYVFLGNEVILTEDGKLINPNLNCLAGASSKLITGVENIMNYVGCSLTCALNMASLNVAGIYGLRDRGKLAQGYRADIILFERKNNKIMINQTWLKGELVFDRKE